MNRAQIIGRLGRNPEVRSLQDGTKVCNLSVATTEKWTDKQGDKQERTEWHRVVLWGRLAEVAEKYLKKGSQVFLAGSLETRSWEDQDGSKKYSTEIVVRAGKGELEMLGGKQSGESSGKDWQAPTDDNLDDDLPFWK